MKKRNKFEALFPNGKLPDVDEFNRSLDAMSEGGRKRLREKIYKISFITWSVLPDYQRNFIEEVIIHDRQAYADFMQQKNSDGSYPVYTSLSYLVYSDASSNRSGRAYRKNIIESPGYVCGNLLRLFRKN